MKLSVQKRLAANLLKCSPKRVRLDTGRLDEIKEAITKADIGSLIGDDAIKKVQEKGVSRARARKKHLQKRGGKQKGHGKRKGKATARSGKKEVWMAKIRTQRKFIRELKESGVISQKTFRMLYLKTKGGFFRSRRHIKIFINEHNITEKKKDA